MFTIKRSRNMNPSYSIIRSLCCFFNQVVLSSEKFCISPCVIRQKAMQCFVLSDRRLCNVFLLLSDKRLCDVFFVIRQKAMQWDFVIKQKAIQCCCLGWQTKGYEMGIFSPASNICIYIYYIFIIYR